ncbi:MAG: CdaR family protein [Bacteroidales bacterium]|nr:CdaR family protein [Bacteroidales bacterium]MCM1416441.1 CdaR family protein [bacterium]MCM1423154.1 CdaR family protein [bacterium]
MKNKLTKNLGLKIASFLCAAVLWLLVTNINDPVVTYRVADVPVTIKNANLITDRGQVYEVLDGTDTVDVVTVSAPRSIIDSLDKSNIVAEADVNDLTSVDTVAIKFSTNKYNDKLDSIRGNIDSVKLSIEEKQTRSLPLRSVTTGDVREGYMVGDVTTEQNLIRIAGPKSVISRVTKAQAEVDVSGFTSTISTDSNIRLYDEEGEEIAADNIEKSISRVRVSVDILELKEIPLTCKVTGRPAEGYGFTGEVSFTRSSVTVAARSNYLARLDAIEIPEGVLDVTDAEGDVTALVDINDYLPTNVILAEENFEGRINVVARVEAEQTRTLRIPVGSILFEGLPDGYDAVITEPANECSVTFAGLAAVLETMTAEDITAVIDLNAWMESEEMEEFSEGSYWMPVNASAENVRQSNTTEVRVHLILEEDI